MDVLVVDDERTCRLIYRRELERGGYHVLEASDGLEALDILQNHSVDLITVDIAMPKMGGFQLCDRLLSRDFACHFHRDRDTPLPILIITSHVSVSNRVKSLNRGVAEFLAKGFQPGTLLKRVNQVLKPTNPYQGLRALIISECEPTAGQLSEELIHLGLEPQFATAQKALSHAGELPDGTDVVFIDSHQLSEGEEVCRSVRRAFARLDQPIIVMLPETSQQILLHWFDAGATDFLLFPFNKSDLKAKMMAALTILVGSEQASKMPPGIRLPWPEPIPETAVDPTQNEKRNSAIIHNIGNVLNSVMVSCSLLREKTDRSHFWKLSMAQALLLEQGDNVYEYLQEDPKGRKLLPYLINVGTRLKKEYTQLTHELRDLETKLQLIQKMIHTQPSYDQTDNALESCAVDHLLDTSISVLADQVKQNQIKIVYNLPNMLKVKVIRPLMVHVLINLIKNAIEAMTGSPSRELLLTGECGDEFVEIRISDSGIGLTKQQLNQLFAHGYTTKPMGHGIGLAFCRRAIRKMKGIIDATSEGRGKGTSFSIRLPILPD